MHEEERKPIEFKRGMSEPLSDVVRLFDGYMAKQNFAEAPHNSERNCILVFSEFHIEFLTVCSSFPLLAILLCSLWPPFVPSRCIGKSTRPLFFDFHYVPSEIFFKTGCWPPTFRMSEAGNWKSPLEAVLANLYTKPSRMIALI